MATDNQDDYQDYELRSGETFEEFVRRLIILEIAKKSLLVFLWQLQQKIAIQQKAEAVVAAADLLKGFRSYAQLIPTDVFDELTTMMLALVKALSATDEVERRQAMLVVEIWHDSKPKVVLDLPRLRQLVFNVTL